jgi:hypothetical protein
MLKPSMFYVDFCCRGGDGMVGDVGIIVDFCAEEFDEEMRRCMEAGGYTGG